VRRERVSQVVRRESGVDRGVAQALVEDPAYAAVGQSTAAKVEEHRLLVAPAFTQPSRGREPAAEGVSCLAAERHQTFLAALAVDADHAAGEVEVVEIQAHEFAHAQARGVEQLEDRAVACRALVVAVDCVQQREHLIHRERARQRFRRTRCRDALGGVDVDPSVAHGMTQVGTYRGQLARDRCLAHPTAYQVGHEAAHGERIDAARRRGLAVEMLVA